MFTFVDFTVNKVGILPLPTAKPVYITFALVLSKPSMVNALSIITRSSNVFSESCKVLLAAAFSIAKAIVA